MPNVLANIARMTSATTGTGTLTLGTAVTGCLSFADSGITNGQVVTYCIEDYSEAGAVTGREVGVGTYTASGTTLSRTTVYNSTAGGTTKLNCSGRQHVFITVAKQDMDARQPQENGFENRTDSSISFNNGNRTLTITPTGTSFSYFTGNTKYTKSGAEGVAITDTEGLHYVYYDGPTLSVTTTFTPSMITTYALVAAIYWDADNNLGLIVADERHGSTMDSQTHLYNHLTFGARYGNGLALSSILVDQNGSSATHAQFGVSSGEIWDEDIQFAITAGSPQTLAAPAQIPVFYRSGASGVWRKVNATAYPLTTTGTGRMAWNQFTGGSWGLTEITNGQYGLMHYLATTNILEPIIAIMGQAQYSTLTAAQAAAKTEMLNLSTGALATLSAEFVPIATLIFETQNSYSNAVKTRTRSTDTGASYIDWRSSRNFATSGVSSNSAMFSTVSVSGQSDVVADTVSDTLTLAAGSNITITTNATTDTITFASNTDAQSFDNAATTVAATTINASVNHIRTAGYYAVGDGGGALYKRSSGSPTGAGTKYITSNGGSVVWELAAEPVMNVQQFGAYNDGTNAATTTAAFQAAAAFSKTVYVPRGTFAINGTVTISLNGSYWYGAGQDNSTITSSSTNAPMFSINGSLQGVTIKDLFLTRSVTSTSGAYGINCGGVTIGKAMFESLRIKNQFIGMYLGATDWSKVSDVTVENSYAIGFHIKALAGDATCQWYFQNCLSQFNNNQGYLWESTAGVSQMLVGTMENCATYANTGVGLAYAGNATTPIQGVRIQGGFFGDSGYSEIYLDTYGNQHMISDCFVELAGTGATGRTFNTPKSDQGHGIEITANNTAVLISDCHINGCSWGGIKSSATETTISNVRAMNNGAAALSGERNGIYIEAGTSTISGGRIGNTGAGASQLYGIRGTDGANVTVTSVDLTNNATAPVYWDSNGASAAVLMCLPVTTSTAVTSVGYRVGNSAQHYIYSNDANNIGIRINQTGPYYALGNPEGASNVLRLNSASGGDIVLTTGTGPEVERARIDVSADELAVSTKFTLIRNALSSEGAYSASGEYIQVTNSLDDKPYYAIRRAYNEHDGNISTGANTLSDALIGKWKSLTNGNAWNRWDVSITPLSSTSGLSGAPASAQQFAVVNREVNPTNRHADTDGWFPEQRVNGKPWIIGEQMVPETQDFTALLGNTRVGYNVFGGYSVSRSPWTANFNKRRATFSSSSGLLGTYTGDVPNLTPVRFEAVDAGVLPTGLSANTTYWTIRVSATTSRFATSLANAQSNIAITYTSSGTAPVDLIWYEWEHAKNHVGFQVNPNGLARGGYAFGAGGYKAYVVSVAVSNGGTGYTAGDLLTFNTGLSNVENEEAVVKVLTVNGSGVIQTAELFIAGAYVSAPSSPKGVTGGTGSNAQFSFTMATEDNVRPRGALQINGRFDYGIDFMPLNLSSGTTFPSTFANHAIRLPNGTTAGIAARNAAGSADIPLIALNSSNIIQLGNSTSVFVDPTNNRLGIGATPSDALEIVAAAATARVKSTSGIPAVKIQSVQASTSAAANLTLTKWGANDAATPNFDSIGEIRFDGLSTTPGYAEFAKISCTIGSNSASGAAGDLRFYAAPGGTGSASHYLTLTGQGYLQPQAAQIMQYQPAETTKSTTATLTAAEVFSGILNYTGTGHTITFPTGASIQDDYKFWSATNLALDFSVINTGSGACTMAANSNTTVGSLTVSAGSSGLFRIRKTGNQTFTIYRIA